MRVLGVLLLSALLSRAEVTYKIRLTNDEGNRVVELTAEKYVAAVLAGESSVFRSNEGLEAMAIAARTYAARLRGRHASEGFDFCATTHCQRLDLHGVIPALTRAAEATAGQLLWFEGKPAFSAYTRDCGGRTENVEAVWPDVHAPYLSSREDPYCTRHGSAVWSWSASSDEIMGALQGSRLLSPETLQRIAILNRTDSGRARTLELEGGGAPIPISASSFRFAIGRSRGWNTLRSDRYEVSSGNGQIRFRGSGEGHGVGLCQHGADEMGIEGFTYREILAFYYPGTVVGLTGTGLSWSRMGGETVVVFTTHPDRDRSVLALAEDLNRRVEERLGTASRPPTEQATATRQIEIRVYPDIDTFRNATGEPGWIAAHASGSRIDIQPVETLQSRGILRQTLRHELFHVSVEGQAAPGLPVWFREGLVEWLDSPVDGRFVPAPAPQDGDIRQRQDRSRAEQAYHEARARVSALVNRYGEGTVLTWLKRGLPEEVTNSSTSNAPTKRR